MYVCMCVCVGYNIFVLCETSYHLGLGLCMFPHESGYGDLTPPWSYYSASCGNILWLRPYTPWYRSVCLHLTEWLNILVWDLAPPWYDWGCQLSALAYWDLAYLGCRSECACLTEWLNILCTSETSHRLGAGKCCQITLAGISVCICIQTCTHDYF